MKFVASYSGGKESALAVYKAINEGHEPVALITTYNTDAGRSHFHGLPEEVLQDVSDSVGIPLWLVKTSGEAYTKNFEAALTRAKEQGAEACVFGDIDIQGHFDWCSERCKNVGLTALFPLWGRERKDVVYELIDLGFTANISVINAAKVSDKVLGQKLTKDIAEAIAAGGADICGENGEYHTFVSDGPIFRYPVSFTFGERAISGDYTMLGVLPIKEKYRVCCPTCEKGDNFLCDISTLADEIASTIGLLNATVSHESIRNELLFVCELAYNLSPSLRGYVELTESEFQKLEQLTLQHKREANRPGGLFVLPMGGQGASLSHVLRVKCKALVRLLCKSNSEGIVADFAHLLSGYFYYLAFKLNTLDGIEEKPLVARKNSHNFFANRECRYFPCHQSPNPDEFSCLFCYCPLYRFDDCGGTFEYTRGIKTCMGCDFPHRPESYDLIIARLKRG